jgi:hypothetical protein
LAATLNQARLDFVDHDELSPSTQNVSLLPKKLLSLLQGEEDAIKADRYEWYLYLQIPSWLNGQLTLPSVTTRLPIFKHYNIYDEIVHASADGQKFESRRETFKTRYSSKYFGTNKGVSSVSLIANHAAINAHVIGANEHESHFIFDLLMSNSSEINPNILSTDTHGVNHVNFALLDLFGYTFAPRYAKVGNVINEIFDVIEDKSGCVDIKLKKPINIKCIIK